jgi:hypothetical protein
LKGLVTNLSAIRKPDGSEYRSNADKVEGIVEYYENIYRIPISDCLEYSNCIDNFLGTDILSNPVVRNSKLTDTERGYLDSHLSIEELDSSLEKCNLRSAPGIDGMSNIFIKKYWQYLRTPLYNYALTCFEKKN